MTSRRTRRHPARRTTARDDEDRLAGLQAPVLVRQPLRPDNTHHGLLLVNNDDIVAPGTGFDTHPHRDMEIVTWVLRGSLVHQDSTGHSGVIYPGPGPAHVGRARHPAFGEERLLDADRWARSPRRASAFRADVGGPRRVGWHAAGYQQLEIDDESAARRAGAPSPRECRNTATTPAHHRSATSTPRCTGARLQPGDIASNCPEAPYLHLFVPGRRGRLGRRRPLREGACGAIHRIRRPARHRHRARRRSWLWEMHAWVWRRRSELGSRPPRPVWRARRGSMCPSPTRRATRCNAHTARRPPTTAAQGLELVTVRVDPDLGPGTVRRTALQASGSGGLDTVGGRRSLKAQAGRRGLPTAPAGVPCPAAVQVRSLDATDAATAGSRSLLDGLDQPHGLAFAGTTLYVAESDQVDAYDYADGAGDHRRTVAAGLPDAKSPDLHGAYAHALEERRRRARRRGVLLGRVDGQHLRRRTAPPTPPRATIMRVPPGGGPASRSPTACATAPAWRSRPTVRWWTAVNNRDNVADPRPTRRRRPPDYVDDHPPEAVARLTPGRELGWPYCNPDGGPGQPAVDPRRADQRRRQQAGLRVRCRRSNRASAHTPRRWA